MHMRTNCLWLVKRDHIHWIISTMATLCSCQQINIAQFNHVMFPITVHIVSDITAWCIKAPNNQTFFLSILVAIHSVQTVSVLNLSSYRTMLWPRDNTDHLFVPLQLPLCIKLVKTISTIIISHIHAIIRFKMPN